MIDIKYENGGVRIDTIAISKIFSSDELPLKMMIKNSVSNNTIWQTNLNDFMWASYPENEMNSVLVETSKGSFVCDHKWDILRDGSIFYKSLWFYCQKLISNGIKPKGLVIGTHDGEFGEWVPVIMNDMSDAVLVEASDAQFLKLKNNYGGKTNVKLIKNIVTTDGKDVTFYEGGRGYTNSVVERVIKSWEIEKITDSVKSSIGINELIQNNFNDKLDWIHMDVEGLDAKLLMAIDYEFLPNFIIYEDYNLDAEEKNMVVNLFSKYGYKHHSNSGIAMFNKI